MSRDKQISEMMQVIKEEQLKIANDSAEYQKFMANGVNYCHADALYNAGYRKASDIAREIFEEIEKTAIQRYKVGDTVYQTDGIRIYELEMCGISWRNNKPYYETESIDFDDTAIGKSIFLTREEAENALE